MRKIVCAKSVLYAHEIFGHLGVVEIIPDAKITTSYLKNADALIVRSKTQVNSDLLRGTSIQFVGTATAGTDHVDLTYLREHHIAFSDAASANALSVAEYVLAALLSVGHKTGVSILDKTLGIIGAGNVGQQLAKCARALGMRVLQNDPPLQLQAPHANFMDLDPLLREADIVSLHVPLLRAGPFPTYRMVDAMFLSKLKPGCIFVNTSRGEVIDETALLSRIQQGMLGSVVLDVWDHEPHIHVALLKSVMLGTPHIAGYSTNGRVQGSLLVYQKLCQFLGIVPIVSVEQLMKDSHKDPIIVKGCERGLQEGLWDVVKQAYDIDFDHQSLLKLLDLPNDEQGEYFKHLRQSYRHRFEFSHYPIVFEKENHEMKSLLEKIHFLS